MVSQKSWRHLTKKPISFKEYLRIITNLKTIPDQAVALVCGAMVERGLERAIASRLKKLEKGHYHGIFDGGGMLSGFMARMKMGYALSLFGAETYNDLDNVREIRNAFAPAIHQSHLKPNA